MKDIFNPTEEEVQEELQEILRKRKAYQEQQERELQELRNRSWIKRLSSRFSR